MIETLRIIASAVLCFTSFGSIIGNWCIFVKLEILKRDKDTVDPEIPFAGIFGLLGLLIAPIDGIIYYAWIPVIVDPSCFQYVIFFRRIRRNSRS